MAKGSIYRFIICKTYQEVPNVLEDNTVYVDEEDHFIHLKCLCGCGEIRKLPMKGFYADATGHWEFIQPNTIHPSINVRSGCKSHLSLKNGIVQ